MNITEVAIAVFLAVLTKIAFCNAVTNVAAPAICSAGPGGIAVDSESLLQLPYTN